MSNSEIMELYHYGTKGQKWGIRRFQNLDGSLTSEGRIHYGAGLAKQKLGQAYKAFGKQANRTYNMASFKLNNSYLRASRDLSKKYSSFKIDALDIANRKGVTDFLSGLGHTKYASSINTSAHSNYVPKSVDFTSGFSSIKRYSDLIGDRPGNYSFDRTKDWLKKAARYKPYQDSIADAYVDLARRPRSRSEGGSRLEILTDRLVKDKSSKPEAYRAAMGKTTDSYIDNIRKYSGISLDESISRLGNVRSDARRFILDYNTSYNALPYEMRHSDFIMHHGTKGQKWGRRQFQNPDGSLTPLGRIHYGVGAARNAVGKGAGKIGNAIRKKVAPTSEELDEQIEKQLLKKEKKDKKELLRELKSDKKDPAKTLEQQRRNKKIEDMTDQEVMAEINRYKNEIALKALAKDANKSRARLHIEEAGRQSLAKTFGSITGNLGQGVANAFDTKENKAKRKQEISKNLLQEKENYKKLNKLLSGKKDSSQELAQRTQDSENARRLRTNQLELRALRGDENAANLINDLAVARRGNRHTTSESAQNRRDEEIRRLGSDFLRSNMPPSSRRALGDGSNRN